MEGVNAVIEPLDDYLDRLVVLQGELRTTQDHFVRRGPGGRELALVQTKLDEARFWVTEAVRALLEAE